MKWICMKVNLFIQRQFIFTQFLGPKSVTFGDNGVTMLTSPIRMNRLRTSSLNEGAAWFLNYLWWKPACCFLVVVFVGCYVQFLWPDPLPARQQLCCGSVCSLQNCSCSYASRLHAQNWNILFSRSTLVYFDLSSSCPYICCSLSWFYMLMY